jgi:hypothetical protein
MRTCMLKIVIYTLTSYNHVAMLGEVKYKGWLHWICADWLWNLTDLSFCVIILFFTSLTTVTWLVETCRRSLCIKLFVKHLCNFVGIIIYDYMILTVLATALQFSVSWRISVYAFASDVFKIHFDIIPLSTPRSAMGSVSFRFPHKNPACTSLLHCMCHVPNHQVFLNLICVWIDLAQDEDSLRALVNAVMGF